ncbi:hypothetical protein M422DRAFT_50166 [Sphaerobolus stellatus SS14]|uniref:Uncharacterized protein n=1 Tax=Sphaerobolus stellatus (strain SS14) TaxID=990650 RepID=A0A0C9U4U6_SPHS4|nr:hypothetical protein M422DRAFT_50166 [Sphaerobolus stellatus SS14]
MQWESLVAEGAAGRSVSRALATPIPSFSTIPSSSMVTTPAAPRLTIPPLTDSERSQVTDLGGCWKCRKVPSDVGWTNHVGRICPGDAARGILPGRDFIPVKEAVGMVLVPDGEDQPDHGRQYVDFVMGGFDKNGEDQPETEIAQCYLDDSTDEEDSDSLESPVPLSPHHMSSNLFSSFHSSFC